MISFLFSLVAAQIVSYPPWPETQQKFPPGCRNESTFPDGNDATVHNYYNANRPVDPCAPIGTVPVVGQQVYIQDPLNFCILLPNPYAGIISDIYAAGKYPTILDGEGYLQSFCLGSYLTPGAWPLPTGGITAAHVLTGTINGQKYVQISGNFNCDALKLNCKSPDYSDGGQYDTAPYYNYGKSPYSGVDTSKNPNMKVYVMQAGNGIFCMRVCEVGPSTDGMQTGDPCNVKMDTAGCFATMNNPSFADGFDMEGKTYPAPPQLPPSSSTSSSPSPSGTVRLGTGTGSSTKSATGAPSAGASSSGSSSSLSLELLLGLAALV